VVSVGASTSKPNPPLTPRAKRLASVIDEQGIRGDDQTNGEDGYGYGYEHQDLVRRNPSTHVASDIQQRCDPKEAQREDHDALQKVRESGPDSYHGCPSLSPAPLSCLYSPKCLEEEFCELRELGILRSSLPASNAQVTPKITHLGDGLAASRRVCCTRHVGKEQKEGTTHASLLTVP
jgi:hypothetical protein